MVTTTVRAPKKYLDADRTKVSPEWLKWRKETDDQHRDLARDTLLVNGDNDSAYFPEEYDKDLGEGSWIFVVDPPNGSVQHDFDVPELSLWYARPHILNIGRVAGRYPYQAVIQTPAGDLHLWPHEYTLCPNPQKFLGLEGVEVHSLGGDPVLDEEQVFYLTSRGIPPSEAVQMLFAQVKSQNYCYITFPDYAVQMFSGVGSSIRSHIHKNPRPVDQHED